MRLYSLDLSNFASKCRIVIYEKGLTVEVTPPPGGSMSSPDFKKLNPLGRIPVLQLDDGRIIAESEIINEYLEEKFPERPLLPKDPEGRAHVRFLSRLHDLYLEPPVRALLPLVFGKSLDDRFVQGKREEIGSRLSYLEELFARPWAAGDSFTMADAAFAPTIFFITGLAQQLGAKNPLEPRPKLSAWWDRVHERPSTKRTLTEQHNALSTILRK
jgi:glutathione S-transferase